MPRRTPTDRNVALVLGVAAALLMGVKLTEWPVRADVFDPMLNRGPARALVEPIAHRWGVLPASIVWGTTIGGLVYWLAPTFRQAGATPVSRDGVDESAPGGLKTEP